MPMKGALPIFRLAGIRVYLHFTWFIVAALEVTQFAHRYHNPIWAPWNIARSLASFCCTNLDMP
jgi:hypothetical protein